MAQLRRSLLVILAIGNGVLAIGCGGGAGEESKAGGVISIDGSSTVMPVSEAVAEEFMKKHPGTRVTVGESGTTAGFQKFCRNEIDVSDASRPIKDTEIADCAKAGITVIELPVAYDGLTVVVNPKNTWAASMTVAELKKLWAPEAEGKVTRWSQIRAGWPDREIRLFGPGTASGTFDFWTEVIVGKSRASRGDYTASEDDNVLVQGVSRDELALGYFGLAYYELNKSVVKAVPVDDEKPENGEGAIAASFESVRGGTYVPLSRPLFVYVNAGRLSRPEVQQFMAFYLAIDVETIRRVGYVPLTDAERQLAQQRLTARTTGTMYPAGSPAMTLEQRLKSGR